jgi:hypothetical protein
MVKANQSLNGYGNFKVNNQEQLAVALKTVNEALGEAAPAIDKAGEAAPPLYVITGMEKSYFNTGLKSTLCRCLYTI